ncbi:MAG: tetratricopeptide repeat protein, partial [Candidatus Cloacimonadaceae bacterium]|nr:tetratricopeptide repeat protein [Candidatus Cloacimonadaceae bacterium]
PLTDSELEELKELCERLINVEYDEAQSNYSRILDLIENSDIEDDPSLYTSTMFRLGEFLGRSDRISEAQDIFLKMQDYAQKRNLDKAYLRAQANFAITKAQSGLYHEAIDVWENMLDQDTGLPMRLNLLNNISVGYGSLGNYNKAIEYALKTLDLIDRENLDLERISPLINLGSAYNKQSRYEKALEVWLQALSLAEGSNNLRRLCECLNDISIVYGTLKQTDTALEYARRCLDVRLKVCSPLEIATSYNNFGYIHETAGNLDEALEYYSQAEAIYHAANKHDMYTNCLLNIASINTKKGNYETALQFLDRALEHAKDLEIPELKRRTNDQYSQVYAAMGDYQKAY